MWHHPANAGHRTQAIVRVAAFYFSDLVLSSRMRIRIGDHSTIWADRRFVTSVEVVLANPPEWNEMQAWKRILVPDSLFIDVGANVGIYSLWAADLGSRVVSVEPMADARKALEENARLNGYEFEIVPAALADEPGVMRITDQLATMNHLVPASQSGGIDVEVRTLDSVLMSRKADGLKIDVEGAERLVLEGGINALREGRLPVIQLEWNRMSERNYGEGRQEVAAMLLGYGYRFYRPDEQGILHPAGTDVSRRDLFAVIDGPQ